MEAPGIEPGSESFQRKGTTCVFRNLVTQGRRLRTSCTQACLYKSRFTVARPAVTPARRVGGRPLPYGRREERPCYALPLGSESKLNVVVGCCDVLT